MSPSSWQLGSERKDGRTFIVSQYGGPIVDVGTAASMWLWRDADQAATDGKVAAASGHNSRPAFRCGLNVIEWTCPC
ncbi:MAG: hypothetical protein ABIV25_00600 [Paracoccaceae bacterium]